MTPDEFTISESWVDVGDNHKIYLHDWGNKQAKTPIIYIHGGPGSGTSDKQKANFDPTIMRVIFFDQRGSGRSLPYGQLDNNSTDKLASDIVKIMDNLKIKSAIFFGSSWGSTLSLYFAINYPKRVKALLLSGIFTASTTELIWQKSGAVKEFYPDTWDEFLAGVPSKYKSDPYKYLFQALKKDKPTKKIVYQFMKLQSAILKLDDSLSLGSFDEFDDVPGLIELYYLKHNFFLKSDYIFKNAFKIKSPVILIQGRFDMVCPPKAAYKLNKLLSQSKIIWTINGHLNGHEAKNIQRIYLNQLLGL